MHKLCGGMRAHKVHKVCWQVGDTTGTGALWQYPVSYWGVTWSMCRSGRVIVEMLWLSVVFALYKPFVSFMMNLWIVIKPYFVSNLSLVTGYLVTCGVPNVEVCRRLGVQGCWRPGVAEVRCTGKDVS